MAKRLAKCSKCKGSGKCSYCSGTGVKPIINSKVKGASYERNIAKLFSGWCGFNIKRTPSSGGLMKTGDICPTKPEDMVSFPFNIELKNRQSWDFRDLLERSKKDGIFAYWEQCINDASFSRKIPLLIFTKRSSSDYCMMHLKDAADSGIFHGIKDAYLKTNDGLFLFKLEDLLKIDFRDLNIE